MGSRKYFSESQKCELDEFFFFGNGFEQIKLRVSILYLYAKIKFKIWWGKHIHKEDR